MNAGIYSSYVLDGQKRRLNIREFSPNMRREAYHIKPLHEGGKTIAANCQMMCKDCIRRKAGK